MTPVRARRGRYIHLTHDVRTTVCGKRCDGWLIEPTAISDLDPKDACPRCVIDALTN